MTLLPEIEEIYFCPDFEGTRCFGVTRNEVKDYSHYPQSGTFRKPGAGMLNLAIQRHHPDTTLMVGDRPEDRAALWRLEYDFSKPKAGDKIMAMLPTLSIELGNNYSLICTPTLSKLESRDFNCRINNSPRLKH